MKTQPNDDDDVGRTSKVARWNDKTRKLRDAIFRNNKKVSIVTTTMVATTVDEETKGKSFEPINNRSRMKNRWNKLQNTVNKKIKQSVKDMETSHRTQPQHCIGPLFVGHYSPSSF